jgi:hypothetical protein
VYARDPKRQEGVLFWRRSLAHGNRSPILHLRRSP